ncbi:hypothetical protein DNTS_001800 [Danionella cerebrum]|uniref:Very-long-chain 3-oxoacyl-CoA reductase n=1 Tax=Danionella cerebrum TaxID=2873325 RepID=A0A553MNS2_9TELE|nr:hypothetical protein DNTS_001800 [Danionella translucida]
MDMESFTVVRTGEKALFWVGALITASLVLWLLFKMLTGFRIWVLGNGNLLSPKLGKWAVVTGATDGIGKSYAEELARRGFSMMLISRSQEKLDDVARSLESTYNVETKTIAVDFGEADIYPKIEKGLAGLEIGVLVNNVGISYSYPEFFLHIPDLENFITTMINVNITSVCQVRAQTRLLFSDWNFSMCKCGNVPLPMTRLVLPRMESRTKGVILNISSASGMFPVPLLTVYSSTKASICTMFHGLIFTFLFKQAFVDFFSRGLQAEYKSKGIIIQSVLPFFVATKMTKIRKPTLDKPTPDRYVAAELNTVGLQDQTNGYFPHAVMVCSLCANHLLIASGVVDWLGDHRSGPHTDSAVPGTAHEQGPARRIPEEKEAALGPELCESLSEAGQMFY